jgi:hypothetical protein
MAASIAGNISWPVHSQSQFPPVVPAIIVWILCERPGFAMRPLPVRNVQEEAVELDSLIGLEFPPLWVARRTWNWTFPAGSGRSPSARKNYRFVKGRESRLPKQARAINPKPSRIILLPPTGTVEVALALGGFKPGELWVVSPVSTRAPLKNAFENLVWSRAFRRAGVETA